MPLPLRRENEKIGVTLHRLPSGATAVVAVNYSAEPQQTAYTLNGVMFEKVLHGAVTPTEIVLEPYGTAVFTVK